MSNSVIQVENLGKKYTIRHEQRERYTALRDVITNKFKSIGKRVIRPFTFHHSPFTPFDKEEFWALKDVSFEVNQGDRIGIIGRNGAGKTTLLKILSRITEPTTGRIKLKGRVASLLEVGTGFHPELTGRENIFLNGAILGMSKTEIKKKFDEIVDFSEIEKFLDTPVKRYSSGMYVRLAFAVAAHLEPEILLVDEVLAVGDAAFQKKCLGKMEDVSTKEGRTVLFVSHNMGAINSLCQSSILLQNGQIDLVGRTQDVVQRYMSNLDIHKDGYVEAISPRATDEDLDVIEFYACNKDGIKKNVFSTTEQITFLTRYLQKRNLPGLRVGLDFVSFVDGDVIFRSYDDDTILQDRSAGYKTLMCSIPADLLKPGTYMARLQIGIQHVRLIVNGSVIEKINVELIDGVNSFYSDYRPGRIMPRIKWTKENA